MTTFYERFAVLAREKGYSSPTAAGEAMGFRSGTVSVWKLKGSTPQENTLQIVSDFFGVSKDWLAGKPVDREGKSLLEGNNQSGVLSEQGVRADLYVPRLSFDTPKGEVDVKQGTPTLKEFADNVLRLALFGNNPDITADDLQEIRDYAQLILAKKARKANEK